MSLLIYTTFNGSQEKLIFFILLANHIQIFKTSDKDRWHISELCQ